MGCEEEPASTWVLGGLFPAFLSLGIILDSRFVLIKFDNEKSNETVPRVALELKSTQIRENF